MSRYKTKDYSNRREYLDWLAERYGVDRADVVLLASILGTDQDFDGLPSTLADLPAAEAVLPGVLPWAIRLGDRERIFRKRSFRLQSLRQGQRRNTGNSKNGLERRV